MLGLFLFIFEHIFHNTATPDNEITLLTIHIKGDTG
jgi:hypothetical protein